MYMQWTKR